MKLTLSLILGSLTLSFSASAANDRYEHKVTVEYEDWAQQDNANLVSAIKRALTDTDAIHEAIVTTRHDFLSPVFRGLSASISGVGNDVTERHIIDTLQGLDVVKRVSPVQMLKVPSRKLALRSVLEESGLMVDSRAVKGIEKRDGGAFIPSAMSSHVMTGVDKVHAEGVKGKGIRIAILDSGFEYKQAVFGNAIGPGNKIIYGHDWAGDESPPADDPSAAPPNVEDDDPYTDCDTHGTEVLGIAAANPTKFGMVGTAPEASYELHRVSSCGQSSASDDLIIKALIAAHERGVDIITTSIGGYLDYPDDPISVVAARIIQNGTYVQFTAGNKGQGLYTSVAPGSGIEATAIGSVANTETPVHTWGGSFTTKGKVTTFRMVASDSMNYPAKAKVWAPASQETDPLNSACTPYPADLPLPDFNNTVVIINVPLDGCNTDVQFDNLAAAGVRFFVMYALFPTDAVQGEPNLIGTAGFDGISNLPADVGKALFAAHKQDKDLTISFENLSNFKDATTFMTNNITGGRMNGYSGWGPTADGRSFPTFAAPGGNVLTIGPKNVGGFIVDTGTSFAAPFVAGVAALLKSRHPDWHGLTIRNVLSTTANPMPYSDAKTGRAFNFLAPVFQQGGGLIDAYRALHTTTIVDAPGLSFNDSTHDPFQPKTLSFKVRNIGTKAQVFKAYHLPAISGHGINSTDVNDLDHYLPAGTDALITGFVSSYASLSITPSSFTLSPGGSASISVTINSLPASLNPKLVPFYGGYISLNSTTDATQTVTVPYTGIATNIKKNMSVYVSVKMLSHNSTSDSYDPVYADGAAEASPAIQSPVVYNITYQGPGKKYAAGIYPAVSWAAAAVDIIDTFELWLIKPNGDPFLLVNRYDHFDYQDYTSQWDIDGTSVPDFIPAGEYRWRIRAKKIYGDEKVADDWVVADSHVFVFKYTKESVGLPAQNQAHTKSQTQTKSKTETKPNTKKQSKTKGKKSKVTHP
ncbi:uncharacterized protein RSE6_11668 [Rhynchosporium secalis]|uniref:Subtilisin-like serine protease n=1 Tax=Rhynchosporium secalis TaxID=38038 RepID=A0A1E1MNI2_RHYSE|nr:uncharacterized protein RSE6_11668 [Rhynchosporium secalis]